MQRRDVVWIAAIWIVVLILTATAAFYGDGDPTIRVAVTGLLAAVLGAGATSLYLFVRRHVHDGRDVLWISAIWAPLLVAAVVLDAAPAAGAVGAVVTGWYVDRRRRIDKARRDVEEEVERAHRRCPECGARMRREADTCPVLEHRSTPWIRQGGRWWLLGSDGVWQVWDEDTEIFEPYHAPGAPATAQDAKL